MTRQDDLIQHVRKSYALIREYEGKVAFSDDPKEKARCRQAMEEQWALVRDWLAELSKLGGGLPADIADLALVRQPGSALPRKPSGSVNNHTASKITWLHLSDLHWGEAGQSFNREQVWQGLLRDISDTAKAHGPVDALFFSGDVTWTATPAEYSKAAELLDQLLAAAGGLPKKRLFVVPGNHDVDWRVISLSSLQLCRGFATSGRRGVFDSVNDFLGPNLPFRQLVLAKFANFFDFLRGYLGWETNAEKYFSVQFFEAAEKTIAVLALNSAWISPVTMDRETTESDRSMLLLGEQQLADSLALAEAKEPDLCIALLHHPLPWLQPEESRARALLLERCDLVLHGHLHDQRISNIVVPGKRPTAIIPAGVCYHRAKFPDYTCSYNLVSLDLETRSGTIYFRQLDPQEHWKPAVGLRDAPQGKYSFNLAEPATSAPPVTKASEETTPTVNAGEEKGVFHSIYREMPPDKRVLLESYLNRLANEARWVSLIGVDPALIADVQGAQISLDCIYTELDVLEPESPGQDQEESHGPRRVPIVEVMDRERYLVLLGDPGSGKSTLVNFVALCLAGEALGQQDANLSHLGQAWSHGALLPVRVVLRDFVAHGGLPPVGEKVTGDHLWRFLKNQLGETLADFAPFLRNHLLDRGSIVLLDGLDEVPEAEQRREQVVAAVSAFVQDFPRCRFLLTCRIYAWQQQGWQLPGFTTAILAPFSDGQIEAFIDRWYTHVNSVLRRKLPVDHVQEQAALMKSAIKRMPGLHELACRPLLLTLMTTLHAWRGGSFPEKREELYQRTLELLLDVWEKAKIIWDVQGKYMVVQPAVQEWLKAPRDRLQKALERLAYEVHAGQSSLEGTADILGTRLAQALWEIRGDPDLRYERIVEYIRDRAGILVSRGVDIYTFLHRTFQEYLAARYLTEEKWPDKMASLVQESPERWREIALLAAAKAARGAPYAVWALVEILAASYPSTDFNLRAAQGAYIGAAALVENHLHEDVPEQHREKIKRLQGWLVAVLERGLLTPQERALHGDMLACLGDTRPGVGVVNDMPEVLWCDVPAGEFTMGSATEAPEESPLHRETTDQYYMSRYQITNIQFQSFVKAEDGYRRSDNWTREGLSWRDSRPRSDGPAKYGGVFDYPNHPVVLVSWYEAVAFCNWLTKRLKSRRWPLSNERLEMQVWADGQAKSVPVPDGYVVRLPTELEWEKAARGEDGREYPWGEQIDPNRANYARTGIGATCAAGIFPMGKSPYGVMDMGGNAWDWIGTKWRDDYGTEAEESSEIENVLRIVRGGGFSSADPKWLRCSYRRRHYPYLYHADDSFRIVMGKP